MKILELLKTDLKQAMKEKDKHKKDIIQMVRSNITNLAKEKRILEEELSNEEILGVIQKELKQQNDSLLAFQQGGRDDLVEVTQIKIDILKQYLPKQLSKEEIEVIVKETISELGLTSITNREKGILMKNIMPKVKGKADGKLVNEVVSEFLK